MNFAGAVAKNVVTMNGAKYGPGMIRGHTLIDKLQRPRSVRINLARGDQVNPREFYDAVLQQAKARPISIARDTYGNMILTFRDLSSRQRLLSLPCLELANGEKYELHDPTNPIVHVQVLQVPFEIADEAITRKIERYGEIISHRRGHHPRMPTCENGIRLYRMKLETNIPSYIHFGSESLRVRYSNQPPTCRRCDMPDHQANVCKRRRCFNCGNYDHGHVSCTEDPRCSICETVGHLAEECPEWRIWEDLPGEEEYESDSSGDEDPTTVIERVVSDAMNEDTAPENPTSPLEKDQEPVANNQDENSAPLFPSSPASEQPSASSSSSSSTGAAAPSPLEMMKAQKEHSASLVKMFNFPGQPIVSWGDEIEEGSESISGVKRACSEESSGSTISQSLAKDISAQQKKKNRKNK